MDQIAALWRLWRGGLSYTEAATRLNVKASGSEVAAAIRSFERALGTYHPLEHPVRCGGCGGLLVAVPCAQCGGRRDSYKIPEERHGGA